MNKLSWRDFVAIQEPANYEVWKKYKDLIYEDLETAIKLKIRELETEYKLIIGVEGLEDLIINWFIPLEVLKDG